MSHQNEKFPPQPAPEIINWQNRIGKAGHRQMSKLYSENAILLPTYGDIAKGRSAIQKYFVKFLDKKNLKCRLVSNDTKKLPGGFKISNGLYVFTFENEDGEQQQVLARYTYVTNSKGLIITHHSSEEPDF
jgi:hypothetical protein